VKKKSKKSLVETMTLPALLQMLIRQAGLYGHKPAKKHGRLIVKTAAEILKRFGYPKKISADLAKNLLEQEQ